MPFPVPNRAIVAVLSIIVAVVAALYTSLLPPLAIFWRASKAAAALSNLPSKAQYTAGNVSMAPRAPVYFFSHGGPDVMYKKDHEVYPILQNIGKEITQKVKPKAVVVFSAHWQARPDLIQLNNALETDLIYESVYMP